MYNHRKVVRKDELIIDRLKTIKKRTIEVRANSQKILQQMNSTIERKNTKT